MLTGQDLRFGSVRHHQLRAAGDAHVGRPSQCPSAALALGLTEQLNPTWDERLWFHVRRWEANHSISFQLFDYDRASANDFIGEVNLPLADLIAKAPKPNPDTGVFETENGHITGDVLIDFDLPIAVSKMNSLVSHKTPTLHMCVRGSSRATDAAAAPRSRRMRPSGSASGTPTRRSSVRRHTSNDLTGADTDSSGTLNEIELFSMLDSLGSTLSRETINGFFTRHGKDTDGALTAEELVQCLEAELHKPDAERQRVRPPADGQADPAGTTGTSTPAGAMEAAFSLEDNANAGGFSFTGSNQFVAEPEERAPPSVLPLAGTAGSSNAQQAAQSAMRQLSLDSSTGDLNGSMDSIGSREPVVERVIALKRCPFCHKPRLGKKNEVGAHWAAR